MKKLTTLLVMLFFTAGMAIGQTQNNEATVDQLSVNNSEVSIDQQGTVNDATAYQNDGGNFDIDIQQTGSLHEATATQQGPNGGMEMWIKQIGGDNNLANVTQNRGQNHWADILQEGSDNELTLTQDNTDTRAEVKQIGNLNIADLTQINKAFNSLSNLDVTQDGDDNYAFVNMEGIGEANNVRIYQETNGNSASVTQLLNVAGNNADLEQIGLDNMMTVDQLSDYNTANLTQHGNDNTATVTQQD